MNEVNNLLNRLRELDDAPLIWVNKKVYDMAEEIEILNTNLEVANEDLTRIAQLLDLEEGCTIYDIEDKIERLNNIINELERYINEEYIYDELGMKIFDVSKLQDKLQELKGEDKE